MSASQETRVRPPNYRPIALNEGVQKPFLVPFFSPLQPDSREAVLIFPGGGYRMLSEHEGAGFAQMFNMLGIHAFVLHYRLVSEDHSYQAPLKDAQLGLSYVREHFGPWGLTKLGVVGSSAGGHLASLLLAEPGQTGLTKELIDLAVLVYPVIDLNLWGKTELGHEFLGENYSQELVDRLSTQNRVREDFPSCFVWHAVGDATVPVESSLLFSSALRKVGVPFELHVFQEAKHGHGIRTPHPWSTCLQAWLSRVGWLGQLESL